MFDKVHHRTALVALAACAGFALSGGQALAGHRGTPCGCSTSYAPYQTAHYEPAYVGGMTYSAPVIEYIEPTYVVPAYANTPQVRYVRHGRRHHRPHRFYDRPHSIRHVYRDNRGHRGHRRGRSFGIRIGDGHRRHRHRGVSFRRRR